MTIHILCIYTPTKAHFSSIKYEDRNETHEVFPLFSWTEYYTVCGIDFAEFSVNCEINHQLFWQLISCFDTIFWEQMSIISDFSFGLWTKHLTFEDVNLGFEKQWLKFFTILWHFTDWTRNWLMEKMINRLINNENNCHGKVWDLDLFFKWQDGDRIN